MATTTNYGWTKPTVGGDTGAWGGILNALFDAVDTVVFAISAVANAALARAGGVMTGRIDVLTASMARADKGSISGAQNFDVSLTQYFTFTLGGVMTASFINPPAGTLVSAMAWLGTNLGSAAITWPGSVKWAGGAAPAFTAAGKDLLVFITYDNGTTWHGTLVSKDSK